MVKAAAQTPINAAKLMAEPREYRDPDDPGDVQPWEIDEPWLR